MAEAPRVLIVTDVPPACERLSGIVTALGFIPIVETRFEHVKDALRLNDPRTALLQWRTGNLAALLIGRLMTSWSLPVLCLENADDPRAMLRARRTDAYDVLREDIPDADLRKALQEAVQEGERLRSGGRPRLGHYEMGEILGRGGIGTVYAARDLVHQRDVALKILHAEHAGNMEYVARFTREAKASLLLDHPNLMKVHEAGRARGHVFIAMERVQGQTLDRILRDNGPLDPPRALRMARQLAEGLGHAHEKGFIHRDIKPANVVVDELERVKLLDFGLIKSTSDEITPITQVDEFIGTLQYASPEHLRGERLDPRSDLFSLGVVLYEMLTGLRPHCGANSSVVAMAVASGTPPLPLEEVDPSLPPALGRFVRTLIDPLPALRPASSREMIRAIDDLLEQERREVGDPGEEKKNHGSTETGRRTL
ncbi:MAG: serine/threonine protein kinase [Planctomycetes bacterium]|nr:serine/threonine protein kinase [Planctomycetota bacterium]